MKNYRISYLRRFCLAATALCLTQVMPLWAKAEGESSSKKALNATEIIAAAEKYTVKTKTLNEIGLNLDDGGSGSGTGFIIDKKRGWILTNSHIAMRSPATVTVAFKGGEFHKAKRLFVDWLFDVAVLELDPKFIPVDAQEAQLDCNNLPAKGQAVAIYGHPGGYYFTATRGIVSGTHWMWTIEAIQSDAIVNGGNSGGPLLDLETGKVIGVAYAHTTTNGNGASPVSLSVPMVHVCPILDLLRAGKNPQLRQLPVHFAYKDDDYRPIVAELFDPNIKLQQGDFILGVNGKMGVRNMSDLATRLRGQDGKIILNVMRDNKNINIEVHASALENPLSLDALDINGMIVTKEWHLKKNNPTSPDFLRIDFVRRNTPAATERLGSGQQIVSVDNKIFYDLKSLEEYVLSKKPDEKLALIVRSAYSEQLYQWLYYYVELKRGEVKQIKAGDDMFKK